MSTQTSALTLPTLAMKPWAFIVQMAWIYKVPLLMTYARSLADRPGEKTVFSEVVHLKALYTKAYYQQKVREKEKEELALAAVSSFTPEPVVFTEPWSAESRDVWTVELPPDLQTIPLADLRRGLRVLRQGQELIYSSPSGAQRGAPNSWSLVRDVRRGDTAQLLRVVREPRAKRPTPREYTVLWDPTQGKRPISRGDAIAAGNLTRRQEIEREIEQITQHDIPRVERERRDEDLHTLQTYAWVGQTEAAVQAVTQFLGEIQSSKADALLTQILLKRPVQPAGLTDLLWAVHGERLTEGAAAIEGTQDVLEFSAGLNGAPVDLKSQAHFFHDAGESPALQQWLTDKAPLEGTKSAPVVKWLTDYITALGPISGEKAENLLSVLSFLGVPFRLWSELSDRPDVIQFLKDNGWVERQTAPGFLASFFWQGGTLLTKKALRTPKLRQIKLRLTGDDLLTMVQDPAVLTRLPDLLGAPLNAPIKLPDEKNVTENSVLSPIAQRLSDAELDYFAMDGKNPRKDAIHALREWGKKMWMVDRPVDKKRMALAERLRLLNLELGRVFRDPRTRREMQDIAARGQTGPTAFFVKRGQEVKGFQTGTQDAMLNQIIAIEVQRLDGTGQRVMMDDPTVSFAPYKAEEKLRVFLSLPSGTAEDIKLNAFTFNVLSVFNAEGIYFSTPLGHDVLPVVMVPEADAERSRRPAGLGTLDNDEVFFFPFGTHDHVSTELLRAAMAERPGKTLAFEFLSTDRRLTTSAIFANALPSLIKLLRTLLLGEKQTAPEAGAGKLDDFSVVTHEVLLSGRNEQTRKTRLEVTVLRDLVADAKTPFTQGMEILAQYNEISRQRWVNQFNRFVDFNAFTRIEVALAAQADALMRKLQSLGLWSPTYQPTAHPHVGWLYYFGHPTQSDILTITRLQPTPGLPAGGRPVTRPVLKMEQLMEMHTEVLPKLVAGASARLGDELGPEMANAAFDLLYPRGVKGKENTTTEENSFIKTKTQDTDIALRSLSQKTQEIQRSPTPAILQEINTLSLRLTRFQTVFIDHVHKSVLHDLEGTYLPIVWQYTRDITGVPSVHMYGFLGPGEEPSGQAVRPQSALNIFSGLPLGTKGTFESYLLYFPHITGKYPLTDTVLSVQKLHNPVEYESQEEVRDYITLILQRLRELLKEGNVTPPTDTTGVSWVQALQQNVHLRQLIQLSGTIWGREYRRKEGDKYEPEENFLQRMRERWQQMETIQGAAMLLADIYPGLFPTDEEKEKGPRDSTGFVEFVQIFVLRFGKYTTILQAIPDAINPEGFRLDVLLGKDKTRWGPAAELVLQRPHFFIQKQRSFSSKAQSDALKAARESARVSGAQAAAGALVSGRKIQPGASVKATRSGSLVAAGAGGVGEGFMASAQGAAFVPFPRKYMLHFDRFDEDFKMLGSAIKKLSLPAQKELCHLWAVRATGFIAQGLPWEYVKSIYGHSVGWGGNSILDVIAQHMNKKVDDLTVADLRAYARTTEPAQASTAGSPTNLTLSRPSTRVF